MCELCSEKPKLYDFTRWWKTFRVLFAPLLGSLLTSLKQQQIELLERQVCFPTLAMSGKVFRLIDIRHHGLCCCCS